MRNGSIRRNEPASHPLTPDPRATFRDRAPHRAEDALGALEAAGALLETGYTGTNVDDPGVPIVGSGAADE